VAFVFREAAVEAPVRGPGGLDRRDSCGVSRCAVIEPWLMEKRKPVVLGMNGLLFGV